MLRDRRRRPHVLPADERHERLAATARRTVRRCSGVDDPKTAADAEQHRAGQDHRQEPSRHPELLGHHANLVEEEHRERREHQEEGRVAPEFAPRDHRIAGHGRDERGPEDVGLAKRPQRVRVVVREFAAGFAEEQRVDREDDDGRGTRDWQQARGPGGEVTALRSDREDEAERGDREARRRRHRRQVDAILPGVPPHGPAVVGQRERRAHGQREDRAPSRPRPLHDPAQRQGGPRDRDGAEPRRDAGTAAARTARPPPSRRTGPRPDAPRASASSAANNSACITTSVFGYRPYQTSTTFSARAPTAKHAGSRPIRRAPKKYTAIRPRTAHNATMFVAPTAPAKAWPIATEAGYRCGNPEITSPVAGSLMKTPMNRTP